MECFDQLVRDDQAKDVGTLVYFRKLSSFALV